MKTLKIFLTFTLFLGYLCGSNPILENAAEGIPAEVITEQANYISPEIQEQIDNSLQNIRTSFRDALDRERGNNRYFNVIKDISGGLLYDILQKEIKSIIDNNIGHIDQAVMVLDVVLKILEQDKTSPILPENWSVYPFLDKEKIDIYSEYVTSDPEVSSKIPQQYKEDTVTKILYNVSRDEYPIDYLKAILEFINDKNMVFSDIYYARCVSTCLISAYFTEANVDIFLEKFKMLRNHMSEKGLELTQHFLDVHYSFVYKSESDQTKKIHDYLAELGAKKLDSYTIIL